MDKKYSIVKRLDTIVWEVRDEDGNPAIVKNSLTLSEADMLRKATEVRLPDAASNVRVTPFISTDPKGLPPEISTSQGVLIMGKAEGVYLDTWQKPISRQDWDGLKAAITELNAQGVHHADLKESHIMVSQRDGRTCFDIFDWGAQKYCARIEGRDEEALNAMEQRLVQKNLLPKDPNAKEKPDGWQQFVANNDDFELE